MMYPGMGMGFGFDPTFILVIIGLVIVLAANAKVKSTFNKYSQVRSDSGITGAQAAERILRSAGLGDIPIEHVSGNLSDHYDPRSRVLRLSDSVYGSNSVAAIGVAAHECGHAIQDSKGYLPMVIRGAIVPVANFGSMAAWPLILIGMFMGGAGQILLTAGILCFSAAVLFQLITLPVELDASNRALRILDHDGILGTGEIGGAKKVLTAAALTYIAGFLASILQLLRLVLLFGGGRRRR